MARSNLEAKSHARDLSRLITELGRSRVARRLGVTPGTVSRWKSQGLPVARRAPIAALKRELASRSKTFRSRYAAALKAGQLKRGRSTGVKARTGFRTGGYEATYAINAYLNDLTLAEIERKLASFRPPKRFPTWIANVKILEVVQAAPIGSGVVQVLIPGQSVNESLTEDIVTSGKQRSQRAAIRTVIARLEVGIDEYERLVESAQISSYYPLTEEQMRARAAAIRAKQRLQEKRKAQRKPKPVKKVTKPVKKSKTSKKKPVKRSAKKARKRR